MKRDIVLWFTKDEYELIRLILQDKAAEYKKAGHAAELEMLRTLADAINFQDTTRGPLILG